MNITERMIEDYNSREVEILKKALSLEKENIAESITLLENLTKINPQASYGFALLGSYYFDEKNYADAIQNFSKAILLKPTFTSILRLQAQAKEHLDDLDGAIEDYLLILKQNPNDVECLISIGMIHEYLKQIEVALTYYHKALEIDPNNIKVRERISRIETPQNNLDSDKVFLELKKEIVGQKCCRIDIYKDKTLSIGLGKKCIPQKPETCSVDFYGFWDIRTYDSSWEIAHCNKIIVSSKTVHENTHISDFFNEKPTLLAITDDSNYTARLEFSNNYYIDFFNSNLDDEVLQVLRFDSVWWSKKNSGLWIKGKDEKPVK